MGAVQSHHVDLNVAGPSTSRNYEPIVTAGARNSTPQGEGLVLIFNYDDYSEEYKKRVAAIAASLGRKYDGFDRKGSLDDIEALKFSFSRFNFNIIPFNNLSKDDLKNKIKHYSTDPAYSHYSYVMVFFMSHGGKDGLLVAYDDEINREDIRQPFLKSETLKDAVKMFVFQACRGDDQEEYLEDVGSNNSNQITEIATEMANVSPPESAPLGSIDTKSICVLSTVENTMSYRVGSRSLYIKRLCEELDQLAYDTFILDFLTKVNKSVTEFRYFDVNLVKNFSQTPIIECSYSDVDKIIVPANNEWIKQKLIEVQKCDKIHNSLQRP